ncbi:lycopene cyclase family protein [Croceimicrobium hydrocarbonivorans]|uniref:Lycopene cyclase n=1 Tax=Croceimicrobium hydrocarbonivorans TaxID=2761580 RepID=A0A7H0VDY2_9FLAO|nr:lycopene cyclase family protein [Croceimicrobium hydrocarbonivorans]QNR23930.1 hypothetical protein H4K34_16380 [Croceimicrobium hydrocarbonivorans]
MKEEYDIALIGGGASGLSLLYAMHLQGILDQYSVLLIEPDAKNTNDRTWCFWTDEQDAAWQMFGSSVSKSWSQLDSAFPQRQNMAPYRYVQIRSKDFYRFVKDALQSYPNLDFYNGKLSKLSNQRPFELKLDGDLSTYAHLVFDSRPPTLNDPDLIWQSFVGYRIKAPLAQFETEVCRLMDFEVQQSEGLQFMYFLPTSETEALIELTRFGEAILSEAEAQPEIERYLQKMGISDFEIEEKEINKIPMTLSLNQKEKLHSLNKRYIPIGVRAGVVKASTGFAFKKIAQHSWAIAKALKEQGPIPQAGHGRQYWIYDELLLNLFQKKQSPILEIFKRLFRVHPIPRIFRFLDEESSWLDDLKILSRMPWRPFFWSIGRSLRRRVSILER